MKMRTQTSLTPRESQGGQPYVFPRPEVGQEMLLRGQRWIVWAVWKPGAVRNVGIEQTDLFGKRRVVVYVSRLRCI